MLKASKHIEVYRCERYNDDETSINVDLRRYMMDYEATAKVFKAFCDENRLKILEQLQSGEKCACTLQDALTISQSTLSHHMKILVESGMVDVRKDKKWSYYSLSESSGKDAVNMLAELMKRNEDAHLMCECI